MVGAIGLGDHGLEMGLSAIYLRGKGQVGSSEEGLAGGSSTHTLVMHCHLITMLDGPISIHGNGE